MAALPPFTIKPLGEVPVGCLVTFEDDGGRAIGIRLQDDVDNLQLGMIDSDIEQPSIRWYEKTKPCLILATDWVIYPIVGDHSFPSSGHDYWRAAGLLRLSGSRWQMNFARSAPDAKSGRFTVQWYDLADMALTDKSAEDYALFTKWGLWLSTEDRELSPASPFLPFEAQQSGPQSS